MVLHRLHALHHRLQQSLAGFGVMALGCHLGEPVPLLIDPTPGVDDIRLGLSQVHALLVAVHSFVNLGSARAFRKLTLAEGAHSWNRTIPALVEIGTSDVR